MLQTLRIVCHLVFLFAFVFVQKLPRFFGSTFLAQLVIFLYAILLCLTIYCLEIISTFMWHYIQEYMCIVPFIIAWGAFSFSCTSIHTFHFANPNLNHAVPFLLFTLYKCIRVYTVSFPTSFVSDH